MCLCVCVRLYVRECVYTCVCVHAGTLDARLFLALVFCCTKQNSYTQYSTGLVAAGIVNAFRYCTSASRT
jgi:hypothetical protein